MSIGNLLPKHKKLFIEVLRETANVRMAAEACGFARRTFQEHKKNDREFSEQWDEAMENAVDLLEREAWRRAFEGVKTPQMYQGKVVGVIREYSDRLIEFLLMGNRPEKYGKQKIEMTGKDGKDLFKDANPIDTARRVAYLLTQGTQESEKPKEEAVH